MKVAVVGAGLAGLAVSWYLSQSPECSVTLFDPKGIAKGASGISTGLLHPFPGRRALRSWSATEGIEETLHLIGVSEKALGCLVAEKSGIFRPAVTEQQKEDFFKRSQKDSEAIWQEHPRFGIGLWIPKGITLYSRLYLQGLWKGCENRGVKLVQERISNLASLQQFDQIVLTMGFESLQIIPNLPLEVTKGQTILCRIKERLPFSLVSLGHITPTEDPALCQIGSTYERAYQSLEPTQDVILDLKQKITPFYPEADALEVIEIRAGCRISRPYGYRPIMEKIDPKTWVFTGLGSRGMLYHAMCGKKIAELIKASQ
ncbi:MAG: FAD-binding oxidoreductase [Chlamydiae bacterium]|nr:FAD-binding oxidoreductase [Chlamydiota bacterium]